MAKLNKRKVEWIARETEMDEPAAASVVSMTKATRISSNFTRPFASSSGSR